MLTNLSVEAQERMDKTIAAYSDQISTIRTGRAHPSLLDKISIEYYGSITPLKQVANITAEDARTLLVTVFDKTVMQDVEKAIISSDLGLNPVTAGTVMRIPLPPLTEERRNELVKVVKGETEQAKISIRNIRREMNDSSKKLLKAKEISEDDDKRAQDIIQKATDSYIKKLDELLSAKEKELKEI
ncbi:MAG: ribosome recycling factor [Psittacicella sp.]